MKKKSLHFCSSPLIQVLCQLSRDKFVPLEYSAHNNGSSSKQARLKLNRKDEREEAVAATCRIAVSMAQDSRDVSICPRMYAYFARYRLVHIALYGFTKKVETLGINFTFCFVYALSFASKFFIEIVDTFSGIQLLLKQISMLKYSFVTRVLVSSSLSLFSLCSSSLSLSLPLWPSRGYYRNEEINLLVFLWFPFA